MKMKPLFVLALVNLLLLSGCSFSESEMSSDSSFGIDREPPLVVSSPNLDEDSQKLSPASSSSTSETMQNYFISDRHSEGIADYDAIESLCSFLLENLTSEQYCAISIYPGTSSPIKTYVVLLLAPDRTVVDNLLCTYSGSWAPVLFEQSRFSLSELTQAEDDLNQFLEEHSEITVVRIEREPLEDSIGILVREPFDELTSFVENYPLKDIFWISVQDLHLSNPD